MKKAKKRMDKKPVLTSPWKIGTFVSLLLVAVSIWVGYYIVNFYHVDVKWIKFGNAGWSIDSFLFFKQAYPLVAGVVLVALFSYFVTASAVRRYKFYLDSGQDYRKMISLAESIDDLTSPTQIARLSSYPELQAVLRNYGDQIREISQDIGENENAVNLDELEAGISALLRGEYESGEISDAKAYASIYRKIREHVESNRTRIEEIEKRSEADKTIIGRAALACGRAMESISGAGEDLLEITKSVSMLGKIAGEIRSGAHRTANAAAGPQDRALKGIVADMESSVRKLLEGGNVLHEFSEENNGIAINLALMAARGASSEHDLATFAERVRSTAERFHRLSGTVASIGQGLLGICYALKDKTAEQTPAAAGVSPELQRALTETAQNIEERCNTLQKQICGLGSELQEVRELLQNDMIITPGREPVRGGAQFLGKEAEDLQSVSRTPREDSGAAGGEEEPSEFVIDHGKSWKGVGDREGIEKPERAHEPFSSEEMEESKVAGRVSRRTRMETDSSDFSNLSSLRELDAEASAEAELAPQQEQANDSKSWMEMPGHRWLKIDVEKPEQEEEPGKIDVTVEPPSHKPSRTGAAEPQAREKAFLKGKAAAEEAAEAAAQAAAQEASRARKAPREQVETECTFTREREPLKGEESEDNEPIHDLLELGAVEYIEEAQAQR